jgi:hypothetical protein
MTDKAYTTEALIEKYLNVAIVTGDAESFILATQKYIETFTSRNFKADTEASARLYDGNSRQGLVIDDCVEVTKVEVGANMWGDSFTEVTNETGETPQYYLLPTNYEEDEVPIRKIGLRSMIWIDGNANHRITAKWGYAVKVPADISFVATVIASGMYYQNRGENTGAIKSEKIGIYQVAYADQKGLSDLEKSSSILGLYKKILL